MKLVRLSNGLGAVCGAVLLGGLVGGLLVATMGQSPAAAQRHPDYRCDPNSVCDGLTQGNTTNCGANGICVGQPTSATFSVCKYLKNNFCTDDPFRYGSVVCPGVCMGTLNTPCTLVAAGCQ